MTADTIGSGSIGTKSIIRSSMNAPVKNGVLSFRTPDRGMLSLRLPAGWPEDGLPVSWWWRAGSGEMRQGEVADLAELPPGLRGAHAWVWTPAAETMLAQVTLPTSSRARIAQALPYALEDQLLGEPESLHFAYRPQGGGSLAVGVTARTRLQTWIDALKAAGLEPAALCPATLALPWDGQGWSLTPEGGELIVRTGAWSGFTCDLPRGGELPEALAIALREARAGAAAPESLLFYNPPEAIDLGRWSDTLQLPVHRLEKEFWAQPPGATGFSLLQREFSHADPMRQVLQALRPAGVILSVWVVLGFGFNLGTWWHLKHVERTQRREMYELFQRSFPNARTIVDPALQMARELGAMQSGSGRPEPGDFLPLLAQAAPAIQSAPAVHLRSLSYSDSSLTFDVRVADYQSMEALRSALAAHGLRAKVMDATSHSGTVDGRIRVKPGASS